MNASVRRTAQSRARNYNPLRGRLTRGAAARVRYGNRATGVLRFLTWKLEVIDA
jgi:hypothetical protein